MPDVNSIDIQTEIQWFMRPYLLDFLVEAHAAFQLLPETLFLAVNLLDRYCSRRVVYKRHYQLVGCAALLIAAKYGDRKERVPTIRELKSMCCSLYDDEMFTQMEWHVLQTLNWIIGHPTVDSFLQVALAETTYDVEVEHMTWYICEIALFHKEFISTRPSILARSALALARCILQRPQARTDEWAGFYDSATVLALSHRLYQPSQVLSRKYSAGHLSQLYHIVEDLLALKAQEVRNSNFTSTPPPTEQTVPEPKVVPSNFPATPQKSHYALSNGLVTPPITPENAQFGNPTQEKGNSLLPRLYTPTPTPNHSLSSNLPQYSFQQYPPAGSS